MLSYVCSVHGLKSIGYVPFTFYTPSAPALQREETPAPPKARPYAAVALAVIALFAAFSIPIIYK